MKSGFWQIQVAEKDRYKTAFNVPFGQYEWNVMLFGLKNAPSEFQNTMNSIFNDYSYMSTIYIDDVLIFSEDIDSDFKHCNTFFKVVKRNGPVVSAKKIKLFQTAIRFLGHDLYQEAVNSSAKKVQEDLPKEEKFEYVTIQTLNYVDTKNPYKTRRFYEAILIDTDSIEVEHTLNDKSPEHINYSRVTIKKILSPFDCWNISKEESERMKYLSKEIKIKGWTPKQQILKATKNTQQSFTKALSSKAALKEKLKKALQNIDNYVEHQIMQLIEDAASSGESSNGDTCNPKGIALSYMDPSCE
nr:uncharacterized protein LOC104087515 [Nicotiana tomentosiformis]